VKSIFGKMFTKFMVIILISFILLIVFSYGSINKITENKEKQTLQLQCEQIFSYIDEHKVELFVMNDESIHNNLNGLIKKTTTKMNDVVWVCDGQGKLIGTSADKIDDKYFTKNENDSSYRFVDDDYIKFILAQDKGIEKSNLFSHVLENEQINSISFFSKDTILIFNAYPPRNIDLIIFVHTSKKTFDEFKRSILFSFIFPLLFSIGIGIILLIIATRNTSKPLVNFNNVANAIRGGDYTKRVKRLNKNHELGELSKNFNNMIIEIDELDKSRLSFISDMSHELRTPMTTINGFITGIIDGTIPKEKHKYYLNLVKDEINRLNRLINNLLLLSKIESQDIELVKSDFDINTLVYKTIEHFNNLLKDKDLVIDVNFANKLTYVYGNEDDIERVLFNLIHNAIKFSKPKSKIKIYTKINKNVTIFIEDFGIGIKEEELIRVWKRFYKADKSRGVDKSGTGLGLAIVKKIINNHGEHIYVESKVEQGTKFYFTLELSKNI